MILRSSVLTQYVASHILSEFEHPGAMDVEPTPPGDPQTSASSSTSEDGEERTNFRELSFQKFENMMANSFQNIRIDVSNNLSPPVAQKFQKKSKGFRYFVKYLVPGNKEQHFCVEFKYMRVKSKPTKQAVTVKKSSSHMLWGLPLCLVQMPKRDQYSNQVNVRIKKAKPPMGQPIGVARYKRPKYLRI
ncbi:PREDICTED: uncharacterized protein LOC108560574 [Nicrophorus vespilloides]|uniref:Uncharacterized protein LOC108560574 n=1 Tax=Nicrophorus vespilloides TaxID=110193 RepID=A0ABM1MGH8_NICVS|nr:PREDICTED: uncharacterized protein LOC108560574 [Nicrophorus vespilloides]